MEDGKTSWKAFAVSVLAWYRAVTIEMEEGTDLGDICEVGSMELSNWLEVELEGKKKIKVELEILNLGN